MLVASLALVSCGSTANPSNVPSGDIVITSCGRTLSGTISLQIGESITVQVSQFNYAGPYVFTSGNGAVLTFSPTATSSAARRPKSGSAGSVQLVSQDGSAIVTGVGAGTTQLAIRGGNAGFSVTAVVVQGGGNLTFAPATLALTAVGQTQTVTVSEPGIPGPFTVQSNSNSAVATVSPSSGTSFTVTAGATAGTTAITFADSRVATGVFTVGLTLSSGTIQATRRRP